eukprot:487461-Prymnesium_polylepis.2
MPSSHGKSSVKTRLPGGGIDLSLAVNVYESGWLSTCVKAEGGVLSAGTSSAAAAEPAAEPAASAPDGVNCLATDSHLRGGYDDQRSDESSFQRGGAAYHSKAERVNRS